MTTTITPARSLEQRLAALRHANDTRIARARLKHAIRQGDAALAILLIRDPTPIVATMRVEDLLLAVPKIGPSALQKLLARTRVNPCKTLGGLTQRQRDALADALEARQS